jgi:hypothetical protein
MKLRKVFNMKNPRVKYNVNFLKDKATKDQFNITLSNKFQILEELDNIEDQWSQIKDTQKEWITPETLRKVQERKQKKGAINCSRIRKEKATAQALKYNKAHKEVRKSVRQENIHRQSCCTSRRGCKHEEYERSI